MVRPTCGPGTISGLHYGVGSVEAAWRIQWLVSSGQDDHGSNLVVTRGSATTRLARYSYISPGDSPLYLLHCVAQALVSEETVR